MRIVALSSLLICSLAVGLRAAGDDAGQYREASKKLIRAINADDMPSIQASFDAEMQRLLPPDKATPFFRGLVAAKGRLKEAGAPQIIGPGAVVRVTAERGAWDFKLSLDASGKIAGLLVSEAPEPASAPAAAERFTTVVNKLVQAINRGDSPAVQAMFDAGMQQLLPPDKATPFFGGLLSAGGKLKEAGAPQITGPTAMVRVTAERGAWDFKITLDAAGKISGLAVTPPGSGPTTAGTAVPRSRTPMQLPFRGEGYVVWGGDHEKINYHVPSPGQRRAADILIRGADGLSHKGAGRRNEDYLVYGKEILAAASGTVVTAIDGVPDNEPGSMNPLCAVGNCLIIDQGSNEYAVYAHFKPGSLRVHRGDKVRMGQVLAACGNSGNSSEPHLHFHLQDKAVLQDGAGITPYFSNVRCRRDDATRTNAEYTFLQGDYIQSATKK